MVGTTVIPLNFRWLPPHLQFPVFVHELQCATDGSPLLLRLLPTSRLKKKLITHFPNTYARPIFIIAFMFIAMRLFASALHEHELREVQDYMSMKIC